MKKYILSITISALLLSCNDNSVITAEQSIAVSDSQPLKADSLFQKPVNSIGFGLTQEEMADDSIFTDGSIPTSWEVAGITDVKAFKLFLKQLQSLVLNNDKEQLAKLISYPFGNRSKQKKIL